MDSQLRLKVYLEAKVLAGNKSLADAQSVLQDGHCVRSPVHRLFQLVQALALERYAYALLILAIPEAPADPFVHTVNECAGLLTLLHEQCGSISEVWRGAFQ